MRTYLVTTPVGVILRVMSASNQGLAKRQIRPTEKLYECPEGTSPQLNNTAYSVSEGTIIANGVDETEMDGMAVILVE
jgi:hypothetical protein